MVFLTYKLKNMELEYLSSLEKILNYKFKNIELLKTSLIHRSFRLKEQNIKYNERLEFLGDAVLEMIITDYLYHNFDQDEGFLTSLRSSVVNYKLMSQIAKDLQLDKYLKVFGKTNSSEELSASLLCNTLEAVIGAIYLDSNILEAKKFILPKLTIKLEEIIKQKQYKDYKTRLQEYTQKIYKQTPSYKVIKTEGLEHNKIFESGVFINNKLISYGKGKNKQDSELISAKKALEKLIKKTGILEDI